MRIAAEDRWSRSETDLLVVLIKKHNDVLTSAYNPKKIRNMAENKSGQKSLKL